MRLQGQKRKLGLLEDDDITKDEPNFGEGRVSDGSTGLGKVRGTFISLQLNNLFEWKVAFPSPICLPLFFCFLTVFSCIQIIQTGLSTRS